MDDVLPRLDLALELAAELDQTRKLAGLDALFDGRVERAAERDVHRTLLGLDALRPDERRDVPETHRAHATVLDLRPGVEAPRRNVRRRSSLLPNARRCPRRAPT